MVILPSLDSTPGFQALAQSNPLQYRIVRAAINRLDLAFQSSIQVSEWIRFCSEFEELASWLGDQPNPPSRADILRTYRELKSSFSWPDDLAERYVTELERKERGRPRSNRRVVMLALEQRELNPTLSWMQLTIRFCACGKDMHDMRCRERIRQMALNLKRTLDRLGV